MWVEGVEGEIRARNSFQDGFRAKSRILTFLEEAGVGGVKVLGVGTVRAAVRRSLSLLLLLLLGLLLRLLTVRRRSAGVLGVAGARGRAAGGHRGRSGRALLLTLLLLTLLLALLTLTGLLLRRGGGGGARGAVPVRVALERRKVGRDLLRELVEAVVRAVGVVRGGGVRVHVVEALLVRHLLLRRLSGLRLLRALLADLRGGSRVVRTGLHRRRSLVARSRSRELAVGVVEALQNRSRRGEVSERKQFLASRCGN